MIIFEKEKREILDAVLKIRKCNLISLLGGSMSIRAGEDLLLTIPSGMIYEEMTADDVVVIDRDCRAAEGVRKPSLDSPALVYILEHMPHTNALIRTHRPYATAAGPTSDQIPKFLVTLIDINRATVNVAPFVPSSDIGMGTMAVKYVRETRAAVLKYHDIMAYGSDMRETSYLAIYLEEAAETFVLAKSMGAEMPLLNPEDIAKGKRGWLDYG